MNKKTIIQGSVLLGIIVLCILINAYLSNGFYRLVYVAGECGFTILTLIAALLFCKSVSFVITKIVK